MVEGPFELRRARPIDLESALPVVRGFYDHFGFLWNDAAKRKVLSEVLARSEVGWMGLICGPGGIVGYALIIYFLSLEFDGRVAVLDEFYLIPTLRGKGLGARILREIARELGGEGIELVRLEVDDRHPEAAGLYAREGYRREHRQLWSRRLSPLA